MMWLEMSNKYVLLDFDGVVVDSDILHYQFNLQICQKYQLQYTYDDYFTNHKGKRSIYFFKQFNLQKYMTYELFNKQKYEFIKVKMANVNVEQNVVEALEYCLKNNVPVYLLSSNSHAFEYLQMLGLEHLITASILHFDKSKAASYHRFAAENNLTLTDAISLEDSINIINVQKDLGVNVIRMPVQYDIISLLNQ